MRFWDSSAIVPLLVREPSSPRSKALLREDPVSPRGLLRVHVLRAADALQLAAAILAAGGRPSTLGFVCFDERLATAARKEGFEVVGP